MAVFRYTATQPDATVVTGTVTADTPWQARTDLRRQGLSVHEITPPAPAPGSLGSAPGSIFGTILSGLGLGRLGDFRRALLRGRGHFRGRGGVVALVRELSTLLAVGMPLLEALDSVAKQRRGAMKLVVLELREQVAAGSSLADAMADQPHVFDAVTVSMTAVGESTGGLDGVLEELASFKERASMLKGRIGSALLYPAIVLSLGLGVCVFLMTSVVPGLLESLIEANRELPAITAAVKAVSDALVAYWWLLLGSAAALALGLGAVARTTPGRHALDRLLLKLPGVGELIRKQAVVRIAFVISTLMRSGVPCGQAVQIAQRSTRNLVLRDALGRCEEAVRAGRDIAQALEDTEAFPDTVVQVFALGQHAGRLEEMLERLAMDYDRQVTTAAGRLAAVLEPVLIVLLAGIVGLIAMATILPILEVGRVL